MAAEECFLEHISCFRFEREQIQQRIRNEPALTHVHITIYPVDDVVQSEQSCHEFYLIKAYGKNPSSFERLPSIGVVSSVRIQQKRRTIKFPNGPLPSFQTSLRDVRSSTQMVVLRTAPVVWKPVPPRPSRHQAGSGSLAFLRRMRPGPSASEHSHYKGLPHGRSQTRRSADRRCPKISACNGPGSKIKASVRPTP